MDGLVQAQALVTQFADAIGLAGLAFDEDGALVLQVEDKLAVFLGVRQDGTALEMLASLSGSEGPKPSPFLHELLEANFLWRETDGSTLSIDGPNGPVTLARRLTLTGLAYPDFEDALNRFIQAALAWGKRAEVAKLSTRIDDATPEMTQETPANEQNWLRI